MIDHEPPSTMTDEQTRRIVTQLWEAMEARDWETVAGLLADDFVCEWPVSRERFRGRDNFVAVNRAYPGDWHVAVRQVIAEGDRAASEVIAESRANATSRSRSTKYATGASCARRTIGPNRTPPRLGGRSGRRR